jgi:hypothetical protein
MSAENKVYAALSGAPGVTALVGSRIKPNMLPQGEPLPAILYTRADTDYVTTIHSAIALGSLVQIDVWCIADSSTVAAALAEAVEAALGDASIPPVGRRPELDPAIEAIVEVVSCTVWS